MIASYGVAIAPLAWPFAQLKGLLVFGQAPYCAIFVPISILEMAYVQVVEDVATLRDLKAFESSVSLYVEGTEYPA